MSRRALILGCGYTGRRVCALLLDAGWSVAAANRRPDRLAALGERGARVLRFDAADDPAALPAADLLIYSIPTLRTALGFDEPAPRILKALGGRYGRVVYLSTTGVYGPAEHVDETTPVQPITERQQLRVQAEQATAKGPWKGLVLRPAAIYGPGRGVQVALPRGEYKLFGDGANLGANYVSRIHVDDLAAITFAAAASDLTGAYPVADDQPSTSREIAQFCAQLLGVPMPTAARLGEIGEIGETRRSNRRVDGRAIRRLTGVELRYPSYREGVPAALRQAGPDSRRHDC